MAETWSMTKKWSADTTMMLLAFGGIGAFLRFSSTALQPRFYPSYIWKLCRARLVKVAVTDGLQQTSTKARVAALVHQVKTAHVPMSYCNFGRVVQA